MLLQRPRRFDLIAFDWDGTLFDSTQIIVRCIQRAVADVGGTAPSDKVAAYVIGLGLMQALAHAAPDVPESKYPELSRRYRVHYTSHQNDLALFDGVLELLTELKLRHHVLAVATGKSRHGLDEVLQTGQKVQFGGTLEYRYVTPDKLRASIRTDRKWRDFYASEDPVPGGSLIGRFADELRALDYPMPSESPIFNTRFASGFFRSRYSRCTALTMPRSPAGRTSGRWRRNIRNISAVQRPNPLTEVNRSITSSSGSA